MSEWNECSKLSVVAGLPKTLEVASQSNTMGFAWLESTNSR